MHEAEEEEPSRKLLDGRRVLPFPVSFSLYSPTFPPPFPLCFYTCNYPSPVPATKYLTRRHSSSKPLLPHHLITVRLIRHLYLPRYSPVFLLSFFILILRRRGGGWFWHGKGKEMGYSSLSFEAEINQSDYLLVYLFRLFSRIYVCV